MNEDVSMLPFTQDPFSAKYVCPYWAYKGKQAKRQSKSIAIGF